MHSLCPPSCLFSINDSFPCCPLGKNFCDDHERERESLHNLPLCSFVRWSYEVVLIIESFRSCLVSGTEGD